MAAEVDVNCLTDKVTINMLELMQEVVTLKLNIEKTTKEGDILLAKTRYSQGSTSVSSIQLPTENGKQFNALLSLTENKTDPLSTNFDVIESTASKDVGMQLFGVLKPQSLIQAKDYFKRAILLAVECGNIQNKLNYIINAHKKLKLQAL